jgi:hypothetical protein
MVFVVALAAVWAETYGADLLCHDTLLPVGVHGPPSSATTLRSPCSLGGGGDAVMPAHHLVH